VTADEVRVTADEDARDVAASDRGGIEAYEIGSHDIVRADHIESDGGVGQGQAADLAAVAAGRQLEQRAAGGWSAQLDARAAAVFWLAGAVNRHWATDGRQGRRRLDRIEDQVTLARNGRCARTHKANDLRQVEQDRVAITVAIGGTNGAAERAVRETALGVVSVRVDDERVSEYRRR